METNFRFYVCTDAVCLDDNGEEQVSVYRTIIDSDVPLQIDQIIEKAEHEGDWRIAFGEGDWNLIDKYTIEEKCSSGSTKVIAKNHEYSTM